jgi:hypothetical protein
MIPFKEMSYHATAEKLVEILCDKTQVRDPLFFRVLVGYYFCLAAGQMRCTIATPDRGDIPVNMYALNLAPSGFGKTLSCNLMENEVLGQFRQRFLEETFPLLAERNLPKLADKRARRKQSDPDAELEMVTREFNNLGTMVFSFDSGTSPAVKQLRHKLLMANSGSMNLIIDEIGMNLMANQEVMTAFIELYDMGLIKQKLVKNTSENTRSEEIVGKTPANMLMFGVPSRLLDGGKTEDELMTMLDTGYARRCFFGYVRTSEKKVHLTPEQVFALRTNQNSNQTLQELSDRLANLADMINVDKRLMIQKDTCLRLIEYQQHCEQRANLLADHQEIQKNELANRFFKALKLAGAYAFIDDSPELTEDHLYNAIKLTEDSGDAFNMLLARDKPWVKLAKYIAAVGQDVTQADLAEDLPFYKGGQGQKQELMSLAIAYGYKNNIIIKKKFEDGIEFLRGESLKETDLSKMVVSYSQDMTEGYQNEYAPFDKLHVLTQQPGLHWISHHLKGGYRNEENAEPGFNMLVIDVDGTCSLSTAKLLLKNYKALYYTTKRHGQDGNDRFRIILPCTHELAMDAKDFREFYKNVLEWLPFEVDEGCAHRCKKWLTNPGHYEYTEGELFDVLPFIPKTTKNEERKKTLDSQQSLDNLERWVLNHTGDGNRNVMLMRYAFILLDAGFDFDGIRRSVMTLNDKLPDKLDEAEILGSIMVTIGKALSKR